MPQPLSRVRPKAPILASPEALALRPNLTPYIAEIIARWAYVEANLRTILTYILRSEAAPVIAMLHAATSAVLQINMIHAAGSAKLNDPELEMFEAVLKIAKASASKRNAIAHHVWGYTSHLPDALLLIDPLAYSDIFVELQKARDDQSQGWVIFEADAARTMVYRETDFLQIIEDLKTVEKCTTFLINYLEPANIARDQMYRWLTDEPLIDVALKTIRKSRAPHVKPQQPS